MQVTTHTPPQEPVQHVTASVPWSRDNFPKRTHSVPQAVATWWQPLPLQARPAFQLWLPYPYLPLAWVSKNTLQSHGYNPSCLGGKKMPECDLHTEVGKKPSWTPGAVKTKNKKGNFSMQPQEQWMKSTQSTWCTLHLWNNWIDNKSFQNWGGRFGGKL